MHPRGLSPLDTTIHRPMKQTLRLLLLLMALLLASISGFAETVDSAVACDDVTHCVPSHERRDRLWGADSPSCDRAALLPQHARFGAAPRYDYEPAPQSHQPRPTSRIPDYYKFNPYNLLPYGWLRLFSRPVIPMPGPTIMSTPSGTSFADPFSLDADVPTAACPACAPLAALPCVAVASPFPFIYIPPLGVALRAVPPWMPTAPKPATRPPITIIIT